MVRHRLTAPALGISQAVCPRHSGRPRLLKTFWDVSASTHGARLRPSGQSTHPTRAWPRHPVLRAGAQRTQFPSSLTRLAFSRERQLTARESLKLFARGSNRRHSWTNFTPSSSTITCQSFPHAGASRQRIAIHVTALNIPAGPQPSKIPPSRLVSAACPPSPPPPARLLRDAAPAGRPAPAGTHPKTVLRCPHSPLRYLPVPLLCRGLSGEGAPVEAVAETL